MNNLFTLSNLWLLIGFFGQLLFSMRFILQWLASEKIKRSIVPNVFWYFSLAGGIVLFLYAIHRRDPVFILGQGAGIFIYLRNIYFILRNNKQT
ncbi:MAG: lipid-A-disaccharide synthase N-terminal domain-containing protein [Gammaproteobacteria bacterium]|nr:lipid-A-disaccharide synthase N-terminal domain-containing protein [Gammaproteobacteria bacterium]